ncbi:MULTISPECIES: hypothetical protein [Listeriaceae]|uniref:hypothetical protein n=1 Tax=Listeria TaxID=1637 RepID=UPI000669EC7A|nr:MULTISPECIES: hypothetical protein [Listeria]KMT59579.1 hypothetical protein X559_2544 [Listeria newyorkensis]WAO21535.1 hypothetical protein OTR81_14975 [Listeria newyorkensis]
MLKSGNGPFRSDKNWSGTGKATLAFCGGREVFEELAVEAGPENEIRKPCRIQE